MGLLKSLRRRRRARKLEKKMAKKTAKQRIRTQAKLEKKKDKYLDKRAKEVLKSEAKDLKAQRKHEEQLAKAAVKRAQAQGFSPQKAVKYAGAARIIAPLAVPLAYKGLTLLQERLQSNYSAPQGVSKQTLDLFKGQGAPLKSRIETIRTTLKDTPDGFRQDVEKRLKQLRQAVDTAEKLPEQRRKETFGTIARELDTVANEVASKTR